MKSIHLSLCSIIVFLSSLISVAQVPQGFKYQSVARNSSGSVIENATIGLRISIHELSSSGTIVYQETHTATTNQFGLFTITVGGGTIVSGIFSSINWGIGLEFIEIEADFAGGTSYVTMGTSQLWSVPYALHSATNANLVGPVSSNGNLTSIADGAITNSMLANSAVASLSGVNSGDQTITLVGDITGSGNGAFTTTLANINPNVGTFNSVTVNSKGLVTSATNVSSGWSLFGNSGTIDGSNFIGTTDNVPFNIKVNNQKAGRIDPALQSTFFGYQSGSNMSGNSNTGIGARALSSITNGGDNTAIGVGALFSNTTGSINAANGFEALYWNTSGEGNSALGGYSLWSNTTGNNNSASGSSSLYSNTTGDYNSATGSAALYSNSTGSQNTADGFYALNLNTTGEKNTAIGYYALKSNLTGYNNTACGWIALQNNTIGFGNTATGSLSLADNTTGYNNTAIGGSALRSNLTGNSNTAIGYNAFNVGGNFSNSTAIGYNAQITDNNMIRLGDENISIIQGRVAMTTTSDRRLKTEIKDLDAGLNFIMQLRPVSYRLRNSSSARNEWGFIAQDIEEILGDKNALLTVGKDSARTLGIRYTDFIAPLVKAFQEQQLTIEGLLAKIKKLTDEETQNRTKINKLELANLSLKSDLDDRLKKLEIKFLDARASN